MKKKLFTLLLALVAIATTAQENTINGHEYVDLGLPSGTLWATCNVGAEKPGDYGDYFAWGETKGYKDGKSNFSWNTYKWCNGWYNKLIKYCNKSEYGNYIFTDSKVELDYEDDAAYINWGNPWRMPSFEQIKKLIDNCNWEWTMLNGVYGRKATSKKNGNTIFLPAVGWRDYTWKSTDAYTYFWSRSLYIRVSSCAYNLNISHGQQSCDYQARCAGLCVRPICLKNNPPTNIEIIKYDTLCYGNWYSIDGKRLSGEPKNTGLYIRNGKKIVK